MSKNGEVAPIVEAIQARGDIIDAAPRLYRPTRFKVHLGVQIPAMTVANMGSGAFMSMEAAASFGWSYPVLGATAALSGYAIDHFLDKREQANTEAAIKRHHPTKYFLGNVDIIRGKNRHLSVRSYLFDEYNPDKKPGGRSAQLGIDLALQAEHAKTQGINTMALNIGLDQYTHLAHKPVKRFGKIIKTSHYHLYKHGIKNRRVHDKIPDVTYYKQIIEATPDQAMDIAAELQKERVKDFIKTIGNPKLTRLYARLAEQPNLEPVFLKELRSALNVQLNLESTTARITKGAREGRSNTLHRVTPRNQVLSTETGIYFDSHEQTASLQQKTLHKFLGCASNSELIEKAIRSNARRRKSPQSANQPELLLAASLVLMTGGARGFVQHTLKQKDSLKVEWRETYNNHLRDLLESSDREKYRYKVGLPKKLATIIGALMIAHFGGTWAHQANETPGSALEQPITTAQDFQEVSGAITRSVKELDIKALLDSLKDKAEPDRGDGRFGYGDTMNFGDSPANGKNNPTLFSVTSLSGASMNGYWHDSTQDHLELSEFYRHYPFEDAALRAYQLQSVDSFNYVKFSGDQQEISALQPDLQVSVSLNDYSHFINLPILDGYSIVGAQITSKNNEHSTTTAPSLRKTVYGNNYSYDKRGQSFEWRQYKDPQLQYWIKKQPDSHATNKFIGPMVFPDRERHDVGKTIIEQRVKKALNLPPDAPDSDVLERLRSKYYSLEPFKRDGVAPITLGYENGQTAQEITEMTARIGEITAERSALICNLASLALILGTSANLDGTNLNMSKGFLEKDSDGYLTVNEAHAWTVGANGKIYDPTPSTLAPGEEPLNTNASEKKKNKPLPLKEIGAALGIGAGTIATTALGIHLWRRWRERRDDSVALPKVTEQIEPPRDHTLAKATLSSPSVAEAISTINSILYMRPGSQSPHTDGRATHTLQPADPLSKQFIAALPSPDILRQIAQENGINYAAISPDVLKTIEQLYRDRHAISDYLQE